MVLHLLNPFIEGLGNFSLKSLLNLVLITTLYSVPHRTFTFLLVFGVVKFSQVDNVTSFQKKLIGLALSIILTLRLPQVLDKLDQIMRYLIEFVVLRFIYVFAFNQYPNLICTFCLC